MIKINREKLTTAINEVAATDSGKILLASLMMDCQYHTTYVNSSDPQATHFHAAKRGVYGAYRQLIRAEYLKSIEFDYKSGEDNGRDDNTGSGLRSKSRGGKSRNTDNK